MVPGILHNYLGRTSTRVNTESKGRDVAASDRRCQRKGLSFVPMSVLVRPVQTIAYLGGGNVDRVYLAQDRDN